MGLVAGTRSTTQTGSLTGGEFREACWEKLPRLSLTLSRRSRVLYAGGEEKAKAEAGVSRVKKEEPMDVGA